MAELMDGNILPPPDITRARMSPTIKRFDSKQHKFRKFFENPNFKAWYLFGIGNFFNFLQSN